MNRAWSIAVSLFCVALGSASAQAEVGKASASPGEWFLGFNGGGGAAFGPERQAYIDIEADDSRHDVNFDDGALGFLGLEAGHVFEEPAALLDRIELNVDYRMQSRSVDGSPRFSELFINNAEFGFFAEANAKGDDDESDIEARLSFKKTLIESDSHFVIASLEPFVRFQDLDGETDLRRLDNGGALRRRDDIEADYYGAQLALEVESPVSESLSFIGRAAAGAYYVDADTASEMSASFTQDTFEFSESDNSWGGRFGGAVGVKAPLNHAGASLTLLATIDYLTDVPTIDHTGFTPNGPGETKVDFDDALEVGGRVGTERSGVSGAIWADGSRHGI